MAVIAVVTRSRQIRAASEPLALCCCQTPCAVRRGDTRIAWLSNTECAGCAVVEQILKLLYKLMAVYGAKGPDSRAKGEEWRMLRTTQPADKMGTFVFTPTLT